MGREAQGHRPRKRFGQNFLTDRHVIDCIMQAIDARPEDTIAEIGPGRGALTEQLLRSGARLHVVELDRDLVAQWRTRENPRFSVHAADALDFDFRAIAPPGGGLRIVGNLPYNISTPLLFHLLAQGDCVRDMHFMLQREVVERLGAGAGSADYGRLSVMVQYRCAVTPLFEVPPGAFHPPPRVTSAVVRLLPQPYPHGRAADYRTLENVVRQAFGQRRKTLRNAVSGLLDAEALEALGIDAGRRPETLSVREFVAMSNAVRAAAGAHA
jgi:16S rRNA (adenine1518-N6/adenine1519-N6)-dimethyltransferase